MFSLCRRLCVGRQDAEGFGVARADGAEVAEVQGDNEVGVQPFGQGDYRCIGAAEREIRVLCDQGSDSGPVLGEGRLNVKLGKAGEEGGFRRWAKVFTGQVGGFGYNQRRNDQVEIRTAEYVERSLVRGIAGID
jgi:hypothetical protein